MSAAIASGLSEEDARTLPHRLARAGERPDTRPHRDADRLFVQVVVAATFPVFLGAAVVKRILAASSGHAGDPGRLSILREARVAARTCGSFALMG